MLNIRNYRLVNAFTLDIHGEEFLSRLFICVALLALLDLFVPLLKIDELKFDQILLRSYIVEIQFNGVGSDAHLLEMISPNPQK